MTAPSLTVADLRVLVCGGRDFADRDLLFAVLDEISPTVVIHGDARGADRLAQAWAESRGMAFERYPADWKTHGRSAGPIRNRAMLVHGKPHLVVAFPGGPGTADMVRIATAAGVPVRKVEVTNG